MIVLDASALTAMLLGEPGQDTVAERIAEAAISAVNLAEVLTRLSRDQILPRTLVPRLTDLGLAIAEFDQAQAVLASEIRDHARSQGLGLADCCCLALAMHRALPVLTADRAWATLGLDLDIRLIR